MNHAIWTARRWALLQERAARLASRETARHVAHAARGGVRSLSPASNTADDLWSRHELHSEPLAMSRGATFSDPDLPVSGCLDYGPADPEDLEVIRRPGYCGAPECRSGGCRYADEHGVECDRARG